MFRPGACATALCAIWPQTMRFVARGVAVGVRNVYWYGRETDRRARRPPRVVEAS
jgi:hypothetical protein